MPRCLNTKSAALVAFLLSLCLPVAAMLCLAPSATAADKTWIDGTGQWNVSGNWTPSGQPQAGADVYLTQSDATDRTVTYFNTTNPTALLNSLRIDATGTGTMTLDMPNAHLLKVTTAYIGSSGRGAMTLRSGAQVGNDGCFLGYNSGSTGTATVTGNGSTWTNSKLLCVGFSGNGTLNIEAGGQVSNTDGYLGDNSGSTGTATVTGTGSTWTNSGILYVGYSGKGTLNVQAGGQVSNTDCYLSGNSGSTGTAMVKGAGSTWANSGALFIGYSGSGTLTVADGGLVSAFALYASMSDLQGDGTITVTQGAVLDTDLAFDAAHGTTQTLPFGTGGTLNLTFTSAGPLGAGYRGAGTLRIAGGVTVASAAGYLGHRSGSTGAATVTGAGSTWTNSGVLYVGYKGDGTLTVTDGGLASTGTLYASQSDLLGNGTITVTQGAVLDADLVFDAAHGTTTTLPFGTGGTLNVSVTSAGTLGAGYKGTGTLRIAGGVAVTSASGYLGYNSGSAGTATVTGAKSTWTNSGALCVGYYGNGSLRIEAGGQVSNTTGYLGLYSGSTGAATVTGAGSTWTNNGKLCVGYVGSGTLNIEAGGQVSNTNAYLGEKSSSTCTATVNGSGSAWNNTGSLYVGGSSTAASSEASVTVTNGGQVTVGGTLEVWTYGTVTVNGGTLVAGALEGLTGTIRITDPAGGTALTVGSAASSAFLGPIRDDTGPGSLTKVGSGTLTLAGTSAKAYTGATTIAEGTLKLRVSTKMASTAFDVRSGATFDVRGQTGGFTLAPGRTLKGSGTVLGTLVVGGAVTPGSGPGILTVEDITFSGTGALQIELGGPARGTEYDVLAASGMVTMQSGSTLGVTLINGYVPQGGETFDIMDFAGVSGEFGTLSLPALGGGLSWDTSDLYTGGTIVVTPEPATLAMVAMGAAAMVVRRRRRR